LDTGKEHPHASSALLEVHNDATDGISVGGTYLEILGNRISVHYGHIEFYVVDWLTGTELLVRHSPGTGHENIVTFS
jgi:hypothetical protein